MSKVKVYRFRKWNHVAGETVTSRRMATRSAIETIDAKIIEESEAEIDNALLDGNGMTDVGFSPLVS